MQTDISIVLPVHNEENNIGVLLKKIVAVFKSIILKPYEIIVVDDASDDKSMAVIEKFKKELNSSTHRNGPSLLINLHILAQQVRSGQSKALMRGIVAAQGAFIITMDADLQHYPADIPRLLEKMDTFDMVCGIRKNRSDGQARLICSKIANAFRNRITGDSIADSGCTFRIMRKECIPAILSIGNSLFGCEFFFHPLFVRRRGFRVGEAEVSHRQRTAGKSNYKLMRGRLIRGIMACIRARRLLGCVVPSSSERYL
jgi:glycosyltransferase involved in cell wall biosynthesis